MKKYIVFFLSIILLISNINYKVSAKDAEPSVSADSAVLMDATTGTILYSKNMNAAYPPASTTKTMTALLTLENTKLDDIVKVSKKVPFVDGSKIGLYEGEEMHVKDLLYGMLLLSGNDCAEALAEHVGGSIDDFAKLMNKRAKELGCENTNFVNPSGLYDSNHKTSAKDLALIMRELIKHPEFREISSTFSYKIPPTNLHPDGINLANENKLINKNSMYYYAPAEAGKTGYTIQSQHSYVASASKNGHRLIAAFVHDGQKNFYVDAKNLFNYGFNNFDLVKLYSKGDTVATYSEDNLNIPLLADDDYYYVKEKNASEVPVTNLINKSLKDISFKKGDSIMEASIKFKNNPLSNIMLISGIDHETKSALSFNVTSHNKNRNITSYIIDSVLGMIVLLLAVRIINKRRAYRR
ncbi:serine hydrolase [Clostridium sp. YIM B02515]|uniref:serine-type D-Ala-D-Ala carboxypeptidase n=1 Tax=Clostridium rhizosphaerae TaxID=2803861 RepID=A0ABS1TB15_9CLOT|nr:serine hydrolase [Clostridium rhizosphaerae]MBL4935198.1 serine hydrolase [Clostridium rhizosphaerae]